MNTLPLLSLFLWINICYGAVGDLTVTLLDTYVFPDGSGGSESVEYNPDNNLWYFVDWGGIDSVGSISGDYPLTSDDPDLDQDALTITNGVNSTMGSSGMVYLDDYLYVTNFGGVVVKIDTTSGITTNTAFLEIDSTGYGYPLNGFCYDPDNTNKLYATGTGIDFDTNMYADALAGLWEINADDLTYTRLYDGGNTIISDDYIYHPNGCIVKDGTVYMNEVRLDGTGAFGMYNIESGEFTIDNTVLNQIGDGIVYSEPYLFITGWGNGNLVAMNLDDYLEGGNSTFEVYLTGLQTMPFSDGPADLALGADNVLAIPNQGTQRIFFVQFNIETDSPTTMPTMIPTTEPTTMIPTENDSKGVQLMIITYFALMVMMFN